jgi:hypothetical protein
METQRPAVTELHPAVPDGRQQLALPASPAHTLADYRLSDCSANMTALSGDDLMELSADISATLNRILDAAADNLTFAKLLIKLGLDPNNVTYDALFNRLLELVLANINIASLCALMARSFSSPPC